MQRLYLHVVCSNGVGLYFSIAGENFPANVLIAYTRLSHINVIIYLEIYV